MRRIRQPTPGFVVAVLVILLIAVRLQLAERHGQRSAASVEFVTVAKVFDGDTFLCTDGSRVRLLGVDAPEVSHGNQPAERYGEESGNWLRRRIEGRIVQLRIGSEPFDRYGRRLAWVYDDRGKLINRELLREGAARLLPDFGLPAELEPSLRAAEAEARTTRTGIWQKR